MEKGSLLTALGRGGWGRQEDRLPVRGDSCGLGLRYVWVEQRTMQGAQEKG